MYRASRVSRFSVIRTCSAPVCTTAKTSAHPLQKVCVNQSSFLAHCGTSDEGKRQDCTYPAIDQHRAPPVLMRTL